MHQIPKRAWARRVFPCLLGFALAAAIAGNQNAERDINCVQGATD